VLDADRDQGRLVSTFGREADAAWYRDQYRETGDKAYLRLAEKTEAWLNETPHRCERVASQIKEQSIAKTR
jgi:hypothetical protein